jgi:hypothetical protein
MKPPEIARRRIHNTRLAGDGFKAADEAVRWHLAMQAQDYRPATWSIAQRATGLVSEDVDEALASGAIIRTHVLRPTWHFVARDDIRWLLALSGPRVQQGSAGRYRELGLDRSTLARSQKVIVAALEGGNRLTRKEIGAVLDDAGIDRSGQRMPYLLSHCELEAVIGSGGLAGKQQTFALLDGRVPAAGPFDREDALVELVRRYLTSHGPATVKDMSWWSGLTMTDLRKALDQLGPSEVRSETVDGLELWSVASDDAASPPVRGAHLLQTYDELVVGFTESRFYGDPGAEQARAAWGDRTYPSGVFLLNGRIGGHWRRTLERDAVAVEVHLYGEPKRGDTKAIEKAAADLGRFHGLPVELELRSATRRRRR